MSKHQHSKNEEVRSFTVELRASDEGRTIEGYAALHDSPTMLGWYEEVIAPGAFQNADLSDVRALFNHDANFILARTPGTLTLTIDERGLFYSFAAPDTSAGNDLLESVRRGDISQSSFAFEVKSQSWEWNDDEDVPDRRVITEIRKVWDVSPVTYPAYEDTTVAARSKPEEVTEDQILIKKRSAQILAGLELLK